jgi:hypothetical protein
MTNKIRSFIKNPKTANYENVRKKFSSESFLDEILKLINEK